MSDDLTPNTPDTGEPSMEDILASIRKIIADDDQAPESGAAPDMVFDGTDDTVTQSEPASQTPAAPILSLVETSEPSDDAVLDLDIEQPISENLGADLTLDKAVADRDDTLALSMDDLVAPDDTDDAILKDLDLLLADDNVEADTPKASDDGLDMALDTDAVVADAEAPADNLAEADDVFDDIDALLSKDLVLDADQDDYTGDERVIDPAADLLGDDSVSEADLTTTNAHETAVDQADDNIDMDALDALFLDDMTAATSDDTDHVAIDDSNTVSTGDSDLDLVKSLMADLTDDSFLDAGDADIAIQDAASAEAEAALETSPETSEDEISEPDIMDEILDLTLDSETAHHESDLDGMDCALVADDEGAPETDTFETASPTASGGLSIADIAARADDDADSLSKGGVLASAVAGSASLAALAVTVDGEPEMSSEMDDDFDDIAALIDAEVETEIETRLPDMLDADTLDSEDLTSDNETQESPEPDTAMDELTEEATMPRAAKKDTILDDVTATETASAFASLNSVVEEKAVVAERGDRIGDLVQEALRPMLKDWLDANLKGIVERAVTKEVKRISSGK